MSKSNFIIALVCTGLLGVGKILTCILNLKSGDIRQAKLDLISIILAALCWASICFKYYH